MKQHATFLADSIQISGPRESDGSYRISFRTGEYEQENLAKLMTIPIATMMKVRVEYEGEK